MATEIPTFGRKIDLVTYRRDIFTKEIIQSGKISPECLPAVIHESVPRKSLDTLEKGFKTKPDRIIYERGHEIRQSEWQTIHKDVVLGRKSVYGQFGEHERSWYLRSTKVC